MRFCPKNKHYLCHLLHIKSFIHFFIMSIKNLPAFFILLTGVLSAGLANAQSNIPNKKPKAKIVQNQERVTIEKPVMLTGFEVVNASVPNAEVNERGLFSTVEKAGQTSYDLQTNGSEQARVHVWPNGEVSMAWTSASLLDNSSFPSRGSAVNYRSAWRNGKDTVSARIDKIRAGFTNYVVTENGTEMTFAHRSVDATTFRIRMSRKTAGATTWATSDLPTNTPNGGLWCKAAADGNNVHVIMLTTPVGSGGAEYRGMDGHVLYYRSKDAGVTWDIVDGVIAGLDSSSYRTAGGDAYTITARDGNVAVVLGTTWTDLSVFKSTDNGTSWEKTIIIDSPLDKYNGESYDQSTIGGPLPGAPITASGDPDPIAVLCSDGRNSLAIDAAGNLHLASTLIWVADDDFSDQSLNYYPGTGRVLHWSDAAPDSLAYVGFALDLDPDADITLGANGNYATYGLAGFATMSAITTDEDLNVYIVYSAVANNLPGTDQASVEKFYRHLYLIKSEDRGDNFSEPTDIIFDATTSEIDSLEASFFETVWPAVYKKVKDKLHIQYSRDNSPGGAVQLSPAQVSTTDIIYLGTDEYTGVKNAPQQKLEFGIAPNPTKGAANLSLELKESGKTLVQVMDINGKVVLEKNEGTLSDGAHTLSLDTKSLVNGAYFVRVSSGNYIGTQRLMVMHP
jgi:Secretion system C-terminal sorting domain